MAALSEVSLTIGQGELVAITGPSGSGKSTLLSVMGTLTKPSSGTLMLEGCDAAQLADRELSYLRGRRIGFVFQQFFLLDSLSILDNATTGLLYSGTAPGARRTMAIDALCRLNRPAGLRLAWLHRRRPGRPTWSTHGLSRGK